MKRFLLFTATLFFSILIFAQQKPAPSLKSILLEQLKSTHNSKEWFVPANTAVAGLTAEQAMWKDSSGNHSVAQLTAHLIFWNLEELAKFNDEKKPGFNGNNEETFSVLDKAGWDSMVKKLDSVLTAWENAVEKADETKLQKWYTVIAHIGTHNAYHIGQMIFERKLHGTWNPENGVK